MGFGGPAKPNGAAMALAIIAAAAQAKQDEERETDVGDGEAPGEVPELRAPREDS